MECQMECQTEYQTNSYCQHLIALHLIRVVKYRKKLLQDEVGDFVKLKIMEISSRSEFDVEEIEVDKNHIHILLTISPTICATSYVRRIKQSTTENLWCKFGWLKKQFWLKKTFFSDGYFVCSVVNASAETVRKYIQEQG
jgi:putative transposase